jgi:myo-inositol-1(or 4)-monophosphatase
MVGPITRCQETAWFTHGVDNADLVLLLDDVANAIGDALGLLEEWALAGTIPGQYTHDLAADEAALRVLRGAGVSILSEESGYEAGRILENASVTVVVDPVDGSTNAHRGVPWWCTSLCAVDNAGPRVALVVDRVHGTRYGAVRGEGASIDGRPLRRPTTPPLASALIGLGGWPPEYFGWGQYRSLGAAALELCAVASGVLDGYLYCHSENLAPWDYLGGVLICREAGALAGDASGREVCVLEHSVRRSIVAAGDESLYDELVTARAGWS